MMTIPLPLPRACAIERSVQFRARLTSGKSVSRACAVDDNGRRIFDAILRFYVRTRGDPGSRTPLTQHELTIGRGSYDVGRGRRPNGARLAPKSWRAERRADGNRLSNFFFERDERFVVARTDV